MNTTRRDLLRSTLLVAAVPRVGLQDARPLTTPLAPMPASPPGTCGPEEALVDHCGWIIRREDRDALLGRSGTSTEGLDRPPQVEADASGADSSGRG